MPKAKSKNNYIIVLLLSVLTISIFTKFTFLFALSIFFLVMHEKKLFLFALLCTSLFENIFPTIAGFSVSSLIYIFCLIVLLNSIIKSKSINYFKLDFKVLLFLWILVSAYGSLNYYNSDYYSSGSYNHTLFVLLNVFGRTILFISIIFSPIIYKNPKGFLDLNSGPLKYLILLFIIYFNINSDLWYGYSDVSRAVVAGFDPNETSVLLILIFAISNFIIKEANKFILVIGLLIISYYIFSCVSRTGLIALVIYLLYVLFNLNYAFKKLFVFISICLAVYSYKALLNDFYVRNQETKGLGTRMVLWENSVDLIKENPIFGHGISKDLNIQHNLKVLKVDKVSHNSYIDILTWTGIFGTLVYLALISYCIDKKRLLKNTFSILMIIILAAMFSLSWVYKDVLWIVLALSFVFKNYNYEYSTR